MALKVLVLGGTGVGRQLAEQLSRDRRYDPLLSFAGRTASLQRPELPHRIGGFGGVEGLTSFLQDGAFGALVDATHAFAARISTHAAEAAARAALPLLRLERPAWQPRPGDRWLDAADMAEAARLLGVTPRRVFLAVGRLEIDAFRSAPQHDYVIRAVDPFTPDLPRAKVLTARGPFELGDELALLARERIELVVSKNAGADATYAKVEAARRLGLPLVMVRRPLLPPAPSVATIAEACAWLSALHVAAPTERGE